jgi:hypothetical protein
MQTRGGTKQLRACEVTNQKIVIVVDEKFVDEYLRKKHVMNNRDAPEVYVRIGPPGTGKTKLPDEQYGNTGYAIAPDNTGRWFDGCDRDVILFDDVENGQVLSFSL